MVEELGNFSQAPTYFLRTPLTIRQTLACFFQTLGRGEQQIEIQRQTLCLCDGFSLKAVFDMVDHCKKGFVTAEDLALFLQWPAEPDCRMLIKYFDADPALHQQHGGLLNFNE